MKLASMRPTTIRIIERIPLAAATPKINPSTKSNISTIATDIKESKASYH
jgi:hypothetical protein